MTTYSLLTMDDTLSCVAYRRVLDDLVADEIDAASLADAEVHLALCEGCRFSLAQARTYRRMMRRVGLGMRASASLRERTVALMRAPRGPNS